MPRVSAKAFPNWEIDKYKISKSTFLLATGGASVAAKQGPSVKKVIGLTIAGLLLFISYLYFFVGFGEILEVLRAINPINYIFYYSLAVVVVVLSMFFYSMTWYELLKLLSVKISVRRVLLYCWIGSFVDLIVPFEAVTGEITRIYLATRNSTGHVGRIIASVASQRVLSTIAVLGGLIISSASLAFGYKVRRFVLDLLIAVQVGTATSIFLILYLSIRKEATRGMVDSLLKLVNFVSKGRLKVDDLRTKAYHALGSFYQGIEVIRSKPGGLIKPVVFNFAAWFFHLATYILVFYALDFRIALDVSITVYSISVAVQTIPIALPVGLVEIVMTTLYDLFEIPLAVGGTATALIRILTFWLPIIVGYAVAQWVGIRTLLQRKPNET